MDQDRSYVGAVLAAINMIQHEVARVALLLHKKRKERLDIALKTADVDKNSLGWEVVKLGLHDHVRESRKLAVELRTHCAVLILLWDALIPDEEDGDGE